MHLKQKIIKTRDKHPDWTNLQIATSLGTSKSTVFRTLQKRESIKVDNVDVEELANQFIFGMKQSKR